MTRPHAHRRSRAHAATAGTSAASAGTSATSAAEALWAQQQAANTPNYAGFPLHSCSVTGHQGAAAFKQFLTPRLAGRVLDIGCGPQPLPSYLEDYPLTHLAGIDPLAPTAGPHPFEFVQARAEALPWPDGWFWCASETTSGANTFMELVPT